MYAKGEKILFLYLIAAEMLFGVKVQCYNIYPKKSLYLSFPNVDSRWSLLLQEFMVNPLWLLSLTWARIHSNCHPRNPLSGIQSICHPRKPYNCHPQNLLLRIWSICHPRKLLHCHPQLDWGSRLFYSWIPIYMGM